MIYVIPVLTILAAFFLTYTLGKMLYITYKFEKGELKS